MEKNNQIQDEQKIIDKFVDKVFWLHKICYIYERLYEKNDNKKIMEGTALLFFHDLNDILVDHLILELSKITDPVKTLGKENLTTNYIVEKLKWNMKDKEKLSQYNEELKCFTKYLKEPRNKLLAHHDLEVAINDDIKFLGGFPKGEDKKFLQTLWSFCDYASTQKTGKSLGRISVGSSDGTDELIDSLRKALVFNKLLKDGSFEEKEKLLNYKMNAEKNL